MLPTFPTFKPLEIGDRRDIEFFTRHFPPYSDFNFNSLHAWNVEDKIGVSVLNDNLIVLFHDYITGTPFLSFIGRQSIVDTVTVLLGYSQTVLQEPSLRLISEEIAAMLPEGVFGVQEDRDAFDYIYTTADLANLHITPTSHRNAARLVRNFNRLFPNHVCREYPLSFADTTSLYATYETWAAAKNLSHTNTKEYAAFQRHLACKDSNIYATVIYNNETPIGFSTNEIVSNEYLLGHFAKADTRYRGIYEALYWYTGRFASSRNLPFFNNEQDLGIEQLRNGKCKYKLHRFFKKFTIRAAIDTKPP